MRLGLGLCLLVALAAWIADLAQMLGGSQQPLGIGGVAINTYNDALVALRQARSRMDSQYERAGRFYEEAMGHYRALPVLRETMEQKNCSMTAGEGPHGSGCFGDDGTAEDAQQAEIDAVRVGKLALQAVGNAGDANDAAHEEVGKGLVLLDIGGAFVDAQLEELKMKPISEWDPQREEVLRVITAANNSFRAELRLIASMRPALHEQEQKIIELTKKIIHEVKLVLHGISSEPSEVSV